MKHKIGFNRLGRKPAHRKSLHRNMTTSLVRYERIRTTLAKAKEVRRTVEKTITRAKVDSVHNRRLVARDIQDKEVLAKLFTDVAPGYANRPGGYTRIVKLGQRASDGAEMAILELVDRGEQGEDEPRGKKKAKETAKAEG